MKRELAVDIEFRSKKNRLIVGVVLLLFLPLHAAVGQVVGTPTLDSPANNSVNQPLSVNLVWESASGASSYELQVSTEASFATTIFDQSNITGTSQTISSLGNATAYYWRVRGAFLTFTSAWSDVWSFTTIPAAPSPPLLSSPLNDAVNQPTGITFTWNVVSSASGYRFQVATDSLFSSVAIDRTVDASASTAVQGLAPAQKYYWRTNASNAGGTSAWSSVWSFTTVPPIPSPPVLTLPGNSAINQPTNITLSWSASQNASAYDVQVSADSTFTTTFADKNTGTVTSTTIQGLPNGGKIFWRANASNTGGTSAWSSVWNFATVPQIPASPILSAPANNAVNEPTSLTISWNPVQNAGTYRVQLSADPSFSTLVLDQTTGSSTSASVQGLNVSTTYFWRASASNAGGTSAWSSVWNFATIPPSPSAPVPASPANNAINQPTNITLSWNASQNATAYRVQLSADSTFGSSIIDQNTNAFTSISAQGLNVSKTYFWRVNASNSGGVSSWSAAMRFSTVPNASQSPSLVSPADESVDQQINLRLAWKLSPSATSYYVQVSYSPNFSSLILNDSSLTDTTLGIGPLTKDTIFYWRVASVNAGGKSQWSASWTFRTIPPEPPSPTPSTPPNGGTIDTTMVTIAWSASQRAASYWLQLSADSTFGSKLYNDSTLKSTSQQVSNLQKNSKYFWRVSAENSGGTSPWSTQSSFVTEPSSTAGPVLTSPSNNAIDQPTTLTLAWNSVAGATSYELQVSTDQNFSTVSYDISSITSAFQQVGPLQNGTTYYWRTRTIFLVLTSDWSTTWRFTTIPKIPSSPLLVSPSNGAIDQPVDLQLIWRPSPFAVSYRAQLSLQSDFSTLFADDSLIADTVAHVVQLTENTTYYWRVLAVNSAGISAWANGGSFKTILHAPPVLTNPPNGTATDSTTVLFTWNASSNATSYWLQVSTDSLFRTTFYNDSTLTGLSKQVSGLLLNTKYFWRVNSSNSGQRGSWSQPSSFTTTPSETNAGPALLSPADNSTGVPTTITLSWNADGGASSYELQIATDQNFTSVTYDNSSITNTSQQVGPLGNGTAYYWRVRSAQLLFTSDWSQVWKFTTVSNAIAFPILVSPLDGAINQPLLPVLRWADSASALKYELQVSSDTAFTSTAFDDSTVTADSEMAGPLSAGVRYAWRVRSEKSGQWSPYSQAWKFTTLQSGLPVVTTDSVSNLASSSVTLNGIVNPNGYSTAVAFEYGISIAYGDSIGGIPPTVNGTTASKISNILNGLAPNTTYHYRVSATNQTGSVKGQDRTFTTILPLYPQTVTVNANIYFPEYQNQSEYKPTDYRMVGLPGASNISIDSLVSGTPHTDWDAYWDDGSGAHTLVPFDKSANFTFSCGRAFWLIKKGAWAPALVISSAPLDSSQNVELPLHSGWNLITNPFTMNVAWSSIQTVNGISEPLYTFNGSFDTATTFTPYVGYYFFNTGNLPFLDLPYSSLYPSSQPAQVKNIFQKVAVKGWQVHITLAENGAIDRTTWLGVSDQASAYQNKLNYHKPTGFSTIPSAYFDRPGWDSLHSAFATDIRPSFSYQQLWNFTAWCPERKQSTLSFSSIKDVPEQFEVYLLDMAGERAVNLREDSVYTFSPGKQGSDFLLAVGVKDSIDKTIQSIQMPHEYSLGINYPNPFNPQTFIPVEIPVRSTIVLEVFNILGQEVRSVYSGTIDPGKYWFTWDGKDHRGNSVSSGVYIYRLMAANGVSIAKKMLLMK